MRTDETTFRELTLVADELDIAEREVSKLGRCGPDERWKAPVCDAIAAARRLIRPRARWLALDDIDLAPLFPASTPVERIVRDGEAWLFVATIGDALERRVKELFADNHYLEAVLLDAAGWASVEAVCDDVEAACAAGGSSSRFSPGYCSWTLLGQTALLSHLDAASFGVQLLPSLLMQPLKSVSGIVVRAEPENLRVPPEECATCDARGCTRRRSIARRRSGGGRAA